MNCKRVVANRERRVLADAQRPHVSAVPVPHPKRQWGELGLRLMLGLAQQLLLLLLLRPFLTLVRFVA
jgi:hypothetical protein